MDNGYMSAHSKKGFTLVELLVVIAIIAILSVIGVTVFSGVQKNARDAKRRGDLKAIVNALEIYKTSTGAYPSAGWVCSEDGSNWIPGLSSYFSSGSVPQSPSKNVASFYSTPYADHYAYCYFTSTQYGGTQGSWFMLVVPLENPSSGELNTKCTAPSGASWNYGSQYGLNAIMACNQQ